MVGGLAQQVGFLTAEPSSGQNCRLVSSGQLDIGIRESFDCARLIERPYSAAVRNNELGSAIVAGVVEYAAYADRASRLTVRARILGLIDKLNLAAKPLQVRRVSEEELRAETSIRGAVILHLDLSSRSALTSSELIFTAATGRVLVAEHPDLPGFPVGISLLLPSAELPVGRRALFAGQADGWGRSGYAVQYALATNPGGLGAGRALVEAAKRESGSATLVAYAPLTGLRARIIQVVDHEDTWAQVSGSMGEEQSKMLFRQLTDLLARDTLPDFLDEPAAGFIEAEAEAFSNSPKYRIGAFHRHMGAHLAGVDAGGDPCESDSMWARVYLKYV